MSNASAPPNQATHTHTHTRAHIHIHRRHRKARNNSVRGSESARRGTARKIRLERSVVGKRRHTTRATRSAISRRTLCRQPTSSLRTSLAATSRQARCRSLAQKNKNGCLQNQAAARRPRNTTKQTIAAAIQARDAPSVDRSTIHRTHTIVATENTFNTIEAQPLLQSFRCCAVPQTTEFAPIVARSRAQKPK